MTTYKITRFFQNAPSIVIRTGLTLEEARKHCNDPATSGRNWFDGYEEEKESRRGKA